MTAKTEILLKWDSAGAIRHSISGISLPPHIDNQTNWILAPSAPFLLAHQFGSMKPSHSMIVSGWVLDMLFHNRYVLMPINSALKAARIVFLYLGDPSIKVQFHPKHSIFANSDSIEEGVKQLINNYTKYVDSRLDAYLINLLSKHWAMPEEGHTREFEEWGTEHFEEWATERHALLEEKLASIKSTRDSIVTFMGMY